MVLVNLFMLMLKLILHLGNYNAMHQPTVQCCYICATSDILNVCLALEYPFKGEFTWVLESGRLSIVRLFVLESERLLHRTRSPQGVEVIWEMIWRP